MFARFFVNRPVFANVIAIVIMVVGVVSLVNLPIEQFPAITPPTITVTTNYPGANAQVLADTVASPIEQQVNGVEGMMYMSSTCSSDGAYALTVTFEVGSDLNMAQVLVQNRVAIALPQLPPDVLKQGLTTKKQSTSITMVVCLISPDGRYDNTFLSNYATIRIKDELSRLPGVGEVFVVPSSDYCMRVWLDPERLEARGLTTQDVVSAIQEQNVQVAAGQIGQPPAASGLNFQFTVSVRGRLEDVTEFENIIVKTTKDGVDRLTRVKDVARVELGGKSYNNYFLMNGKPGAGVVIFQLPGANAIDVASLVRAKMKDLEKDLPAGLQYTIPLDTTLFVGAAIGEVRNTIFEAGLLVLLVILIFLQDFRAVLVPISTVPVTIIGAFFAMSLLGFSVNMLTMFGLVLAIGIVVDDAIVIVEGAAHNVERNLPAKEATVRAMDELIGPIIGITLVLMSVFLPTVFLGGITGQLYQQFALTIAATALISAIVAVTLQPAQCGQWLRKAPEKRNFFFRGFNYVYGKFEDLYFAAIQRIIRFSPVAMLVYLGLIGLAVWLFAFLPTGFLPAEDQGYVMVGIQLPDGASNERTREVVDRIVTICTNTPGIENIVVLGGQSLIDGTTASNAARCFVRFKPWSERRDPSLSQASIVANLRRELGKIQEARVFAFIPPAIRGLGSTGGFQMQIQDRGGAGASELQRATEDLVAAAKAQPDISSALTTYRADVPQIFVDVDRTKVKSLDLPMGSVFGTLQAELGSAYVNDFNKFGRTFQVRVQADNDFRKDAAQIKKLRARNTQGEMVPLGTVVQVRQTTGPEVITRYNLYPAASINGDAAAGRSSGEALVRMEQLAAEKLPASMGYEWTGMAYQEKKVSGQMLFVFGMAVLLVYLVLAAQYESWTSPAAVILVVPLGLLGSAVAVWLLGMDNNIYTQIGVVLIIALASKNAILIVEYARQLRAKGASIAEAAAQASRRRLRPILMTSFAFIMGVSPLVHAEGAGAASRRALGTAVFGGMIASTVLAVAFVPVFYVVLQRFSEFVSRKKGGGGEPPVAAGPGEVNPDVL
jgi:HAE1 family hydrophobic/amphiphilic exporter-1